MDDMPHQFSTLLQNARLKRFPKGQIIIYEDDIAHDVYFVKSGVIKLYDIDLQGSERILHLFKSPSPLPLFFPLGPDRPIKWYYSTITESEVYVVPLNELYRTMEQDSALQAFLTRWVIREAFEILVRHSNLNRSNVHDKLIIGLRYLVLHYSVAVHHSWHRITFPVNHQMLAELIGVTRESTSLAMKELQNEGIVRSPRVMTLEVNLEKLNA